MEIDTSKNNIEYTPPFKYYNHDDKNNKRIYLPIAEAKMIVRGDKN